MVLSRRYVWPDPRARGGGGRSPLGTVAVIVVLIILGFLAVRVLISLAGS
jgi:hypothetical protein